LVSGDPGSNSGANPQALLKRAKLYPLFQQNRLEKEGFGFSKARLRHTFIDVSMHRSFFFV
jgi:ribosomal protein L13E